MEIDEVRVRENILKTVQGIAEVFP